jgi:tetratricopeptide (TPR) repeat protein
MKIFQQAAAVDSTFPETNLNIGACYFRLGQNDSGLYFFEKEKKLHPLRASSYTNIASIEFLKENYEQAIAEANQAISLKPYFPIPHLIRLKAAANVKQMDAAQFFDMALESTSQTDADLKVTNAAAIILSNRGEYQKARHFLEMAVRTNPVSIEIDDNAFTPGYARSRFDYKSELAKAHYQLGFVLGMESEFGLSVQESRRAIELDSALSEAYPNLANGLHALGMFERADSVMSEMRRRFPGHEYFQDK